MSAFSIKELSESLTIDRSRRNGCVVAFLLVWLTGWTYGLVQIVISDWSATSWNALVPMGLAELLVLGFLVYSLAGRERLTIRPRDITYEHSAIITFDRCTIRIEDIGSVDLLPLDPAKRKDSAVGVIVITGGDSEIRFGEGLSGLELHELLSRIRRRLDEQRAPLAPTVSASEVAPISHAEREKQDAMGPPESLLLRFGRWLTVPFFIVAGCAFVVGGVSSITTGRPLSILFGILFLCIGLFLSVGLTWASLAVFIDWLRKRNVSEATSGGEGETGRVRTRANPPAARLHAPTPGCRDDENGPRSWKVPFEAILFAPAVVMALIIGFRSLPSDSGGRFFQIWVSLVGLGVLATLPQLKPVPRAVAALILVPNLFFLLWGALRFAPQVMLPFILFAGVAAGACYLWSQSKLRLAVLLALASIPIAADAYFYSMPHMRTVDTLRNLLPEEIQEIRIEDPSHGGTIVISDRQTLALIAKALGDTSPYSPNHEGISHLRQVTIRFIDGSAIDFRAGKGNRDNSKTVWIEFGVEVYQNPSLEPVLQSHRVFTVP